jgi:hypothetical protein
MENIIVKITGTAPLMMHSDRLANPLLPETQAHKELTAKRKKTDEDHLAIARSEYVAGAYWHEKEGLHVPGQNFEATFLGGAKLQKLGVRWKQGAMVLEQRVKLLHDGPKTPAELWESPRNQDCRGVRVGSAKVMRYRPVFPVWAAELTVVLNADILTAAEARKAITDAGKFIGVCEYRPRFGRFEVAYG